jgi:hypothetical protein
MLALLAGIAGLAVIAVTLWCHDDWLDADGVADERAASERWSG